MKLKEAKRGDEVQFRGTLDDGRKTFVGFAVLNIVEKHAYGTLFATTQITVGEPDIELDEELFGQHVARIRLGAKIKPPQFALEIAAWPDVNAYGLKDEDLLNAQWTGHIVTFDTVAVVHHPPGV